MELQNQTPYPALLFRGCIDDHRLCASVMARVTYRAKDNRLVVDDEQAWPVSPGPWESAYGPMDGDEVFYKGGVDVLVYGAVRSQPGKRANRVDVSVAVGDHFRREIVVFGDRRWVRQGGKLVASQADPIDAVPLDLQHAFGGSDEFDELPIPFPANPEGIGYYIDEASAEGQPLPNIEDPRQLIQSWNDMPEPVGTSHVPLAFGPRMERSVEVDVERGQISKIRPQFFNVAFPDMIAERANPGDTVTVEGVSGPDAIQFVLPEIPVQTRLQFGDEVINAEMSIDQIGIEADSGRVFLAFRYAFRYRLIPLQLRRCELLLV